MTELLPGDNQKTETLWLADTGKNYFGIFWIAYCIFDCVGYNENMSYPMTWSCLFCGFVIVNASTSVIVKGSRLF